MQIVEMKDRSLSALFSLIESQPGDYRHIFRGQCNAEWGLVPSLYRVQNPAIGGGTLEQNYDYFETAWVQRFFDEGLPYLPTLPRSYSNDRILAQHFGVPTRFMDWSRDPLVAAFFATEDQSDADAAIFMILPDAHYLPEQVKTLGPHKAISVTPPAIDRRIPAQKSMFTFHPYGEPTAPFVPLDQRPDMGNRITTTTGIARGFAKIVIPMRIKRHLHGTLLSMGYDRRNLFPGLDGVGADIGARARSGSMPH
ncbi:FRG domain-containing protein [Nitratireductor sp. StC3]|uniref:FRG domain-containing protein n=1 Tax=Nitratireductor sp. StC3 TaxID=2126741 RepID=UPI001304C61A|nr:FRG domain-containing protein [Nitratireductor sp. StC3]